MTDTDQVFKKLADALVDAGRMVDYPGASSVASQVRMQLTAHHSRTLPKFAFALAIILVLALIASPEVRINFMQLFGLGNIPSPLTTPTLSMTAQPNPSVSITLSSAPMVQTPTLQPTRDGTPSTLYNPADIRILAKPVSLPFESTQAK